MPIRTVHKNYILLIVAVAQFMVVLDSSIINVALPAIFKGLHYSNAESLQWVVTAYTLTFGGFLLLGGRAADLYGRKKMFMYAVVGFGLSSLLCGLAQNSLMIEATRAIQGLSAAFMSPAALSIILTSFQGKERAKALSGWGAVAAGGAAAGVLFGGILTEYLNWRWNFFVNIPVAIAVFVAAKLYVPESKADLNHSQLDLPGAALVTTGLMSFVYAVTQAPDKGWGSAQTIITLSAAVVLLVGFVINEFYSKHPLMPLSIFKIGNVGAANATQLPITAAMFSMFFFVSLYVQNILMFSPVKSGLGFLPVTIVIGLVAFNMPRVIAKLGYKKPLMVSPLLIAGGLIYLSRMQVGGNYWHDVFPGLILMAIGMGMTFISITLAATSGVPPRESGLASGLLNTSQQVGGALGLAILSGVSAASVTRFIHDHAASVSSQPALQAQAQVHGFHDALLVGALFLLIGWLIAIFGIRSIKPTAGAEVAPAAH